MKRKLTEPIFPFILVLKFGSHFLKEVHNLFLFVILQGIDQVVLEEADLQLPDAVTVHLENKHNTQQHTVVTQGH